MSELRTIARELEAPSNPNPATKLLDGDAGCAKFLGLSSAWPVRRFRLTEGLPFLKLGGRFYYRPEAVQAWLAARETSGAAADEPEEIGVIREIRG